jgi:hypothetical protein
LGQRDGRRSAGDVAAETVHVVLLAACR